MQTQQSVAAAASQSRAQLPRCRFCDAELKHRFVDLGMSPLCQTQIAPEQLNQMEPFYPLLVHVCEKCFLVQLEEYVAPDIVFGADYPYFSSYSDSWLAHAKSYVEHVRKDFGVGSSDRDLVVEIASNDGYLLKNFVEAGVRCLGVEPAAGCANVAIANGVPTVIRFFGTETAKDLRKKEGAAKLILGNNVLAHVPNLNDFVGGVKALLADDGMVTFEFPHLMKLVELNQFDTIYHEHFSYFSFTSVREIFKAHGLRMFDVRELPTHGGSLRIYACHVDSRAFKDHARVEELEQREIKAGYRKLETYTRFANQVEETKRKLLQFLINAKGEGKQVVGYGAPGKGNTLLNYCAIRTDFLDYTVDRNPHKKGTYTPGTRIPILDPARIFETRPDYVLILPWNLTAEITKQMAGIREWGGKFVVPIPELRVYD